MLSLNFAIGILFGQELWTNEQGIVRLQVLEGWLVSGWEKVSILCRLQPIAIYSDDGQWSGIGSKLPSSCKWGSVGNVLALSTTPNCMLAKTKINVAQQKVSKNVADPGEMKVCSWLWILETFKITNSRAGQSPKWSTVKSFSAVTLRAFKFHSGCQS